MSASKATEWTPRAKARLAGILRTILEECGPVVEREWAVKLLGAPDALAAHPQLGRVVPEIGRDEIRELIVTPYRVFYKVGTDRCFVLSVRHSRMLIKSRRSL